MTNENKMTEIDDKLKPKKTYTPPTIETEDLNTYGAVCNGSAKGGRKASTSATVPCNASRLNS